MEGHQGYRFGDVTRMTVRWLGPHARAVRGRIDWLKFGKAIVAALVAGQTLNLTIVAAAGLDAIKDPHLAAQLAAAGPTILSILAFIVEMIRRLLQDGTDAHTITPVPERHADGSQATLPEEGERRPAGDPGQVDVVQADAVQGR